MGGFGDKRLRDFLPTIDAYRPVALTVAAILGLVMVLPGAVGDPGTGPVDDFTSAPAASGGEGQRDDADGPPASTAREPGSSPVGGATSVSPPPLRPVAIPSRPPPSARADVPEAPAVPAGGGPVSGDGPGDDLDGGDEQQRLRIVAAGWASSTGGTPIATSETEGVPEGSLPVGTRVGQTDKVSFVRLAGTASTLVLAEAAAGRRGGAFDASPVELCPVTEEQWDEGAAQPMSAAPAHDAERCVPAEQRSDGTWAFDLEAFDDPEDPRGFALVPSAEAPIDFQITFAGRPIA